MNLFLKKCISFITLIIITFSTLGFNYSASASYQNNDLYTQSEYETQGIRTWVTKKGLRIGAVIIRKGGDNLYWAIKKLGFDGRKVRKVLYRKDKIADALEDIAHDFDELEGKLINYLYRRLQGYVDPDTARMVAYFISTLSL